MGAAFSKSNKKKKKKRTIAVEMIVGASVWCILLLFEEFLVFRLLRKSNCFRYRTATLCLRPKVPWSVSQKGKKNNCLLVDAVRSQSCEIGNHK